LTVKEGNYREGIELGKPEKSPRGSKRKLRDRFWGQVGTKADRKEEKGSVFWMDTREGKKMRNGTKCPKSRKGEYGGSKATTSSQEKKEMEKSCKRSTTP